MEGGKMLARGLAAMLVLFLVAGMGGTARASIWDRLTGLVAARDTNAPETVESVTRHIATLPDGERTALAAAATEIGHWRLANRSGEVFTAAGRAELAQALRTLAPDVDGKPQRLHIHLTPDSLFRYSSFLAELPAAAALSVVIDGRAFPVQRAGTSGQPRYLILVAPGIHVEASDRAHFDEVMWQLQRPLRRSKVRTLALEPGGLTQPSAAANIDPGTRRARPDAVDPGHAGQALRGLSGQIVLVTGSLSGDRLAYKPASGAVGSIGLGDLWEAAAAADVNVIALAASSARQPGSRNWLWQRIGLATADKALGAATLGQFLHMLAGGSRDLVMRSVDAHGERIELEVVFRDATTATGAPVGSITEAVKGTWSDIVSETAGSLTISGMKASLTRSVRQAELDRRIVPFVPSLIQFGYLALVAAGVLAIRRLLVWWRRIWPDEVASEYGSATALALARSMRWSAFAVLFLPLAAFPAVIVSLVSGMTNLMLRHRTLRRGNLSPG